MVQNQRPQPPLLPSYLEVEQLTIHLFWSQLPVFNRVNLQAVLKSSPSIRCLILRSIWLTWIRNRMEISSACMKPNSAILVLESSALARMEKSLSTWNSMTVSIHQPLRAVNILDFWNLVEQVSISHGQSLWRRTWARKRRTRRLLKRPKKLLLRLLRLKMLTNLKRKWQKEQSQLSRKRSIQHLTEMVMETSHSKMSKLAPFKQVKLSKRAQVKWSM